MNKPLDLSRRSFVVTSLTATGGLVLGLSSKKALADVTRVNPQPWADNDTATPNELNAWVVINPDDSVMIRYARAELGQGTMTACAMMIAEELGCDWSKVSSEYASANRNVREKTVYGKQTTFGSGSTIQSQKPLQQVGASARVRLIAAAAARWNVPAAECAAANSLVTHTSSGRTFRFGELVAEAATVKIDKEPDIKTPDQYTLMGKPTPRLDVADKINGSAKYAIDVKLPGMVYAAVLASPVPTGKLKSVDESPVAGMRGVIKVVKLPSAVAVVADSFWRAKQALAKLQPEWDAGEAGKTSSAQFDRAYIEALDKEKPTTVRNDGDAEKAISASGAKVVEAVYSAPYLAHASMEPMNATVAFGDNRLDIWVGTQAADIHTMVAAGVAGMKPEQVYIHNTFVGGGFGRKGNNDEMIQAIPIAKAVGRPVKLVWTREEDMRQSRMRPQSAIRIRGTVTADGKPESIHIRTVVGSIFRSWGLAKVAESGSEPFAVEGLANHPYEIPNTKVEVFLKNTHIPVTTYRSVGSSMNGFYIESFIDEMAHEAKADPVAFRMAMLTKHQDWAKVLDVAVKNSDWGKPIEAGRGRGVAIHQCFGTIVAAVAEVTVSAQGQVKIDKVTSAVDCGNAVNPLTIAEQIEGATVFGLSNAMWGKITVKDGVVEQGNFDTYRVMRLGQAPRIDVHLALSGGTKWGGIGEPGLPPTIPAVTAAIFQATGKRVRSLPIMDMDLSRSV